MRIVHYYPRAREGSGVTVALWAWARAVAAAGHEVAVVHDGSSGTPWTSDEFALQEVGTVAVREHVVPHRGRGRMTRFPVGLGGLLRRGDVLVLHEGWVLGNLVAGEAARRKAVPYIVMPHGVYARPWRRYLKGPVAVRRMLERRLLRHALAVHIFFASESGDVRDLAPDTPLITVPTGFTMPRERWAGGGEYLSWIGRMDPTHKGLDMLVEAVGLLPPNERCRVVLRGYDYKGGRDAVRRMIGDRCLHDWIDVQGVAVGDEKLAFLRGARGYVHPSRWESYGLALVENLALGVPCLVSSSVAMAPDLERRHAALLVDPTPDGLARGLGNLAAMSGEMGERGRAYVANELDWSRCTAAFLAALRDLGVD